MRRPIDDPVRITGDRASHAEGNPEYPGAARAGVSPNRSDRKGKVRLFIVHHYAGTQDPESAWKRFMSDNDRSVSPNYQVNADGSVYEIVPPDRYRAWTTGAIDHQAVTVETQNTSGAPTWGISRESHEAIARLVAWAADRYGFPIQRGSVAVGDVVTVPGVVGHRETPAGRKTATACPGPSMDLDWIVGRAREIAGGSPASVESTSREWDEMATKDEVKAAVLEALGSRPDTVLIHYSGAGRNGIYLAAPGFWRQFSAEEWQQFTAHGLRSGIREVVPVNDRDFDVLKGLYAPRTTAPAALTDAQLASIVAQIKTETKADLSDGDLDRIAKAVRGQFAAAPLK